MRGTVRDGLGRCAMGSWASARVIRVTMCGARADVAGDEVASSSRLAREMMM